MSSDCIEVRPLTTFEVTRGYFFGARSQIPTRRKYVLKTSKITPIKTSYTFLSLFSKDLPTKQPEDRMIGRREFLHLIFFLTLNKPKII